MPGWCSPAMLLPSTADSTSDWNVAPERNVQASGRGSGSDRRIGVAAIVPVFVSGSGQEKDSGALLPRFYPFFELFPES